MQGFFQQFSQPERSGKPFGNEGEKAAARFLEGKGFRVLERNYRCRLGEVDLIVERKKRDCEEIVFVEVKTRRSTDAVSPLELIPYGKQRHVSRVAQHYLASKRKDEVLATFGVVIVDWSDAKPVCTWIENAFELVWGY